MKYVITYDIADERRRARLATALLDFGRRVEESVFVATLGDDGNELAGQMRERIRRTIEPSEDCVHIFPLCAGCGERIEVFGRGDEAFTRDASYYVV